MKSMKRIAPSLLSIGCILCLACFIPACGDDDDDNGGVPPAPPQQTVSAYDFTEANMEQAAADAVDAISPFTDIAGVMLQIVELLATPAVPQFQSVVVGPTPIPGACTNESQGGAISITIDDADNSTTPTAGDTASVEFTNCDLNGMGTLTNGTVDTVLTLFTPATFSPFFSQATMDVTIEVTNTETVDSTTRTDTVTASFTFDAQPTTDIDGQITFTGGNITATSSDGMDQKLGCFTITYTYGSTSYEMAVDAVLNVNGKVMTITTTNYEGTDEPLIFWQVFPTPTYADGGTLFLLNGGMCADAGVPEDIPDTTSRSVLVKAIPGDSDDVEIALVDLSVTPPEPIIVIPSTWGALSEVILQP